MKRICTSILFIMVLSGASYSQSSDAGISMIGKRNYDSSEEGHSRLTLEYKIGFLSDNGGSGNFIFNTLIMNADFPIHNNFHGEVFWPYSLVSGPVGNISGFGDLVLSLYANFKTKKLGIWTVTVAGKIASGQANRDGLPPIYQPSLGTDALILGAGTQIKQVSVYAAYQRSFNRSINENTLIKIGDDVMLRFGIAQPIKKTVLKLGIIAIKRIQKSSIKVPLTDSLQYINVDGSNQLQLNLSAGLAFKIGKKFRLETTGILPLLKIDNNIDGLKRTFTFSAAMSYFFDMP